MASKTVRLKPATHAKLKELVSELGKSMSEVMEIAIEAMYRERFLENCNLAYARLKTISKDWQVELAERTTWDATLADGLDD